MQNGNSSNSQQKPISLSELSFADLAKIRQEKAAATEQEQVVSEGPPEEAEIVESEKEMAPAEGLVVELRDDVDVQEDFCKTPNAKWKIAPLQDPKEFCVYDYLYKLSYGWRRNVCRVGYGAIVNNTSIPPRSTAIRAIEGLMEKLHIIKIEEETHSKVGSLYRILSPDEIIIQEAGYRYLGGATAEAIELLENNANEIARALSQLEERIFESDEAKLRAVEGILGMFKSNIVILDIVKMTISKSTISKLNIVDLDTSGSQNEYSQNEHSEENGSMGGSATIPKMNIVNLDTNKDPLKTSLKTTEEQNDNTNVANVLVVVSSSEFFKELPEATIEKLCTEHGCDKVVEKIQSLDEQYKNKEMDNPGGLLRDALKRDYAPPKKVVRRQKAKQATEKAEKQKKVEEEMRRQEEELRQKLSKQKEKMGKKKCADLREQALKAIRDTEGIKEEFITDVLIEAKENEILKEEMKEE